MTKEIVYGYTDNDGVLFNSIVAIENDVETLDRIKEEIKASSYHPLDTVVYRPEFGALMWNGIHWDRNPKYVEQIPPSN